jgi:hypothetical protein
MPRGRPRKTRVTKKEVTEIKYAKKNMPSSSKAKRTIKPGPWTNRTVSVHVESELRPHHGMVGIMYGSYEKNERWNEKGWYPVIFNIMSNNIKDEIDKYGLDDYIAACEKQFNTEDNKKKYGTIIILEVLGDNSQREDPDSRFISCRAKTNKKSIEGFAAIRKGIYQVL